MGYRTSVITDFGDLKEKNGADCKYASEEIS